MLGGAQLERRGRGGGGAPQEQRELGDCSHPCPRCHVLGCHIPLLTLSVLYTQ